MALLPPGLGVLLPQSPRASEGTAGMKTAEFPILEYDPTPTAVVDPRQCLPHVEAPEYAVLCFFNEAIEKLLAEMPHQVIYGLKSVMGTWPIYQVRWGGR